jgi:hypothetical protein
VDTVKYDRFRGINNRLPVDRLRKLGDREAGAFVPDASNVDLTDAGTFQSRPGYTRVGLDEQCRGLFGHGSVGYYAAGDKLKRLDTTGGITEIATLGSPASPVAMTHTPLGVVCSDSFSLLRIDDFTVKSLAPAVPNPMPVVSAAPGGALPAGAYGLLFAAQDSDLQRSPISFPFHVNALAGDAVTVTAPARSYDIAIFMTAANGGSFYRAGTLQAAQTSLVIAVESSNGEPMMYRPQMPLPAGGVLAHHKGRFFSAVGKIVYYSLPYMYGVCDAASGYLPLPDEVTILASTDNGLFICSTTTTYFIPGDGVTERMTTSAPFGGVAGTLAMVPNLNEWMWFSERGPVRSKDGAIVLLQDEQIAFGAAQAGAAILREQNGLRTFVAALTGAAPSGGAVMGSFIDAEVIQPGATP